MKASVQVRWLAGALALALAGTLPAAADDDTESSDPNIETGMPVEGQSTSEASKDLESVPDPVEQARLETREQSPYGRYLTDQDGMSLYLFEQDEQGEGHSTCYETCAIAWPPYTTEQSPRAGEHIDADKLDTFERDDGTRQVTYNGWPLYYFSGDKAAGDALGQDVDHMGAEWYLLSPDGEEIEEGARKDALN